MTPTDTSEGGFARRAAGVAAFAIPVAYASYLATVIVHEVVGHGFGALAVGGTFTWFHVSLDGMGSASVRAGGHETFVLAAGILADLLLGVPLLILAAWKRVPVFGRLASLLFGILLLNDAAPYAFWGAVYTRGPSDTARIVVRLGSPTVRWAIVAAAGVVHLVVLVATTRLLFRVFEEIAGPLHRARALAVAAAVTAAGTALWFLLDWGYLAPGSRRIPETVGAGLLGATAFWLAATWRPAGERPPPLSRSAWLGSMALAWAVSGAIVFVVGAWMQSGVRVGGE